MQRQISPLHLTQTVYTERSGGKAIRLRIINAKHGKGSVSHPWKGSLHFQMH